MRCHRFRPIFTFLALLLASVWSASAHAEEATPDNAAGGDDLLPALTKKPKEAIPSGASQERPRPAWDFALIGFLRAGYDTTSKDDRYDFVGRNNGFVLDSARVGVEALQADYDVSARVSVEGAADVRTSPNTPQASLSVRLRDAFGRWDPLGYLGVQFGQFKAPWQAEELRAVPDLMFASRAVGIDGVLPGRGFETPGLRLDRQIGVMLSPRKPIGTSNFGVSYFLMVMNGNGQNQLLDDNGKLALVARTELGLAPYVKLGGAVFKNDRTVGTLPNLYNEEDLGLTGDLDVKFRGAELFGAVTRVRTVFPTVGASARVQLAWHAQAAYRFDLGQHVTLAPGYRFAFFDPWQEGGGPGFEDYDLRYHTVGIRGGHRKVPLQGWLNYTFTGESGGRALSNNRLELLMQATF